MNIDIFETIIKKAIIKQASDIHFSQDNYISFRIFGRIKKETDFHIVNKEETNNIFNILMEYLDKESKIFVLSELRDYGHAGFAILVQGQYRFRVNVGKHNSGYYIVMRALSKTPPDLKNLGFNSLITKSLQLISKKKSGLFLVVGPTGSGKSTTLASLIKEINTNSEKNIISLEDPIEYLHTSINSNVVQKELGRDMSSFSNGLKAALREDPDVILVGEIRDKDTLNLALKASETGHLVLSTLHTDNAVSTINRIIALSEAESLTRDRLSSTLLAVLAQKLEVIEPISSEQAKTTGLKERTGRILNYEMLTFTPALLNILKEGENDKQINSSLDNTPFSQSYNKTLSDYVKDSVLTESEALKFSTNKKDLQYMIESLSY